MFVYTAAYTSRAIMHLSVCLVSFYVTCQLNALFSRVWLTTLGVRSVWIPTMLNKAQCYQGININSCVSSPVAGSSQRPRSTSLATFGHFMNHVFHPLGWCNPTCRVAIQWICVSFSPPCGPAFQSQIIETMKPLISPARAHYWTGRNCPDFKAHVTTSWPSVFLKGRKREKMPVYGMETFHWVRHVPLHWASLYYKLGSL